MRLPSPRKLPLAGLGLGAILLAFFGDLLDPRGLLATRDMLTFHLALRDAWAKLARSAMEGPLRSWHVPQWDSFAHGGQPLISNPNYGALYPPSWLGLAFPAHVTVNLLIVVHAALAAWGAARLARRLGCDSASALLAAIAYACGPTYLSLLQSLPLALGMSWFPWVIRFALDLHPSGGHQVGLRLAIATALLVLTGDPAMLAMAALALILLALTHWRAGWRPLARLGAFLLLGTALAGAQLLPTLARLADSPRAGGLSFGASTGWSLPWRRLPELFFPGFYGDVAQPMIGRYFGWGVHDGDFPYLVLLDVGTPLALLGLAAVLGFGGPRQDEARGARSLWRGLALVGLFLALGRHNPLYAPLWRNVPGLAALRYPEKFALLGLTALVFAGAVAWTRMLDERARGKPASSRLPAGFAAILALVAGALVGWTLLFPVSLADFLRSHSAGFPLSETALAGALAYYRAQSLLGFVFAAASLALFLAARSPRPNRRTLALAALLLVTAELAIYARPLVRTFAARQALAPPAALAGVAPAPHTVFSEEPYLAAQPEVVPSRGDSRLHWVRAPLERLDSRAGNLVGLSYVLDRDFDLTLTRPAARALSLYERLRETPPLANRLLGAWSADHIVTRRPPQEPLDEGQRGVERPAPVNVVTNAFALPPARFIGAAESFSNAELAEQAGIAANLPLNEVEFLIGSAPPAASAQSVARLIGDLDRGDRRRIDYESSGPSLLVIASTFDRHWSAKVDGQPAPIHETLGGYLAVPVPAGRKSVELEFRDPWFARGAATTGGAVLILLLLVFRERSDRAPRRRWARQRDPAFSGFVSSPDGGSGDDHDTTTRG